MNRIDWEHVIDALRDSRFSEISPDVWKQFAETVEMFVFKREEVTKIPVLRRKRVSAQGKSSKVSSVQWSSSFAELLQYHIQRTPGLSLEKCYQALDCYKILRKSGMKALEAKLKVADLLNLKLGHKSIGAILKAVSKSP